MPSVPGAETAIMTGAYYLLDTLPDGPTASLAGPEGRHAADVARVRVGESILIGDGLGAVADCEVIAVTRGAVTARIAARRYTPAPAHTVIAVQAESGATVEVGQPLLVLEAMKMQHTINAPAAGVLDVAVKVGQQVSAGDVLAVVTSDESSEEGAEA